MIIILEIFIVLAFIFLIPFFFAVVIWVLEFGMNCFESVFFWFENRKYKKNDNP